MKKSRCVYTISKSDIGKKNPRIMNRIYGIIEVTTLPFTHVSSSDVGRRIYEKNPGNYYIESKAQLQERTEFKFLSRKK